MQVSVSNYPMFHPQVDVTQLTPGEKMGYDLVESGALDFYGQDSDITETLDLYFQSLTRRGYFNKPTASSSTSAAAKSTGPAFIVGDKVQVRATGQQGIVAGTFVVTKGRVVPGQVNKADSKEYTYSVSLEGGASNIFDEAELKLVRRGYEKPDKDAPAKKAAPAAKSAFKKGDRVRTVNNGLPGTLVRREKNGWTLKRDDGKTAINFSDEQLELLETEHEHVPAREPKFKRGDRVSTPDAYAKVLSVAATTEKRFNGAPGHYKVKVRLEGKGNGGKVVEMFEDELTPWDRAEDLAKHKPKAKREPKPKKEKAKKEPKAKKPEPTGVVRIDEDVKVIRGYVRLHGRNVLVGKLDTMLRGIQRKIREELITKKSRYGDIVMGIQESLVRICNDNTSDVMIAVQIGPADDLAKLVAIAGGEKVYPSLTALKAFIAIEGKKVTKEQLQRLAKRLKGAKVGEDDPFYSHRTHALLIVSDAIKENRSSVMFTKQGLSGIGSSELGALLAGIDRHTKRLAKKGCGCKTKRSTSLAGCGCHV